jgi:uncharacterized protein
MPDTSLLQKMRCPISKALLLLDGDSLVSTNANMPYRYKIIEGIPVMLKEDAELLQPEEWKRIMQKLNYTGA